MPIDPEWWFVAGSYRDSRDLDSQVERLGGWMDGQRVAWTEVTEVSDTLRLDGTVTIVTPRDEDAAIAWITENGDALARLDHPTIVFLQDGGKALEEIALIR